MITPPDSLAIKLNRGIELRLANIGGRLVSINDLQSTSNAPTMAVYEMLNQQNITVYSLFRNNTEPIICPSGQKNKYKFTSEAVERLFWKRFEVILAAIPLTEDFVVLSPDIISPLKPQIISGNNEPVSKKIHEILHSRCANILHNFILQLSTEDVWFMCNSPDSHFYQFWHSNPDRTIIDDLDNSLDRMPGVFNIHSIHDEDIRRTVRDTLIETPDLLFDYSSVINNSHVLIIDDTITTGQSLVSVCKALTSCYFPKSITAITMISGR